MKIGIVGLRPRQISDLQARNLPLDISFFGEKSQTATNIDRFVQGKDQVVLMAGHVSKLTITAVPSDKRRVMTGSVSSLIQYLKTFVKDDPTLKEPSRVSQIAPVAVNEDIQPPPTIRKVARAINIPPRPPVPSVQLLKSDVPRGRIKQYTKDMVPRVVEQPDDDGRIDYTALRHLSIGQVARFRRPDGLSFQVWQQRVRATRSYHSTKLNIHTEAHFFDTYVDILVIEPRGPLRQSRSMVEETSPGAPIQTDAPVETTVQFTPWEGGFWRQVFVALVGQGKSVDEASSQSDQAVLYHRHRFSRCSPAEE